MSSQGAMAAQGAMATERAAQVDGARPAAVLRATGIEKSFHRGVDEPHSGFDWGTYLVLRRAVGSRA
jgi:hypothetical protein